MNELTTSVEARQALRWLAQELAWERVLSGLRHDGGDTPVAVPTRAAA